MTYLTSVGCKWHGKESVGLSIYRADLLTYLASGNKQFKLAENLSLWKSQGVRRVLSFGGAWSNHLHALALHTRLAGIESVGVVRGDEQVSNRMLQSAVDNGMRVHFVSREQYRARHDVAFCEQLAKRMVCDAWLAEGGSNRLAVSGCRLLGEKLLQHKELGDDGRLVIVVPVGTGATLAGIASACSDKAQVIGFQVVRDQLVAARIGDWLTDCAPQVKNWSIHNQITTPRYGTADDALLRFILEFFEDTGVCLDPVYTGKVMRQITSPEFIETLPADTHLVFLHTGGLVGNFGFKPQFEQVGESAIVARFFTRIRQLTGE